MREDERMLEDEETAARLEQRVPDPKCPICETVGAWGTWNRLTSIPFYEPTGGGREIPKSAIWRACLQCGFVRFHLVSILNQ